MQYLFLRLARLAFALCFVASGSFRIAHGQFAPNLGAQTLGAVYDPLRTPLTEGKRLEQERRWQEAILHYEKSLKKDPGQRECSERLQICRVHFDVTRRYSDRSFMQTVDSSSATQAFQVLSEVLAKLDVYYVEPIDYYKLALHGTAFLEVALTEQDFLGKHLQNADAANVENFRKSIHSRIRSKDSIRRGIEGDGCDGGEHRQPTVGSDVVCGNL